LKPEQKRLRAAGVVSDRAAAAELASQMNRKMEAWVGIEPAYAALQAAA
jgi:hypothetical protein